MENTPAPLTQQYVSLREAPAGSAPESALPDIPLRYLPPAKVKEALDAGDGRYVIADVRKGGDYEAGHIPTSVAIDIDAARHGNLPAGIRAVQAGMNEATGTPNGGGATIVLICYTGNRCAQAATNILSYLGASMDEVYTMKGGMKDWVAAYPDLIEVW